MQFPLKSIWVSFPPDPTAHYVWWYTSREKARDHRNHSLKVYPERWKGNPLPAVRYVREGVKNIKWFVFDRDNGDEGTHWYVWWFNTMEDARAYLAYIEKLREHQYVVQYSGPFRFGNP